MYLVEYAEGLFVDLEKLDWLLVGGGGAQFSLMGSGDRFEVEEGFYENFFSQLNNIDANIARRKLA